MFSNFEHFHEVDGVPSRAVTYILRGNNREASLSLFTKQGTVLCWPASYCIYDIYLFATRELVLSTQPTGSYPVHDEAPNEPRPLLDCLSLFD